MAVVVVKDICEGLPQLQNSAARLFVGTLQSIQRLEKQFLKFGLSAPLVAAVSKGLTETSTEFSESGQRTVIAAISGKLSRHFGSLRGDLVHDVVLKNAGKEGDVDVVLLLEEESQAVTAALSAARAFPLYYNKQKQPAARAVNIYLSLTSKPERVTVAHLQVLTNSVRAAANLVDMPPNLLNPTTYVDIVKSVWESQLKAAGVELEIIQGTELRDRGYGAIWNVGKASKNLPALVILSRKVIKGPAKTVVWVGKGITYDTGGLSIKSKEAMPTMKVDMGGSAGVFQAFVATVLSPTPPSTYNLHAILCLAENSVDAESQRPDDIITAYSGKTIEVNNTDAEGRLVLCDGVAHACKHLDADVIVEMATLTGAQAFATGLRHGGVLSNHASFESLVCEAGRETGDLAFPLLFCPELVSIDTLMKSEVADMKNSASDRSNAPSSGAGMFVWAHLSPEEKWVEGGNGRWAHVDMAYPVTVGSRATGYGVGMLTALSEKLEVETQT